MTLRGDFMKKILLILFTSLFFFGCAQETQENNTESENPKIIVSETNLDGSTYEIRVTDETSGDISQTGVTYTFTATDGRKLGFAIVKQNSKNGSIYKAIIMAQRESAEFSNNFWTSYKINIGSSNIYLNQAISTPLAENGKFQFLITGGLDTTDITKLMNATLITVGLLNTDNPQVNTILVLPPKFQLAILEYL